MSTLYMTGSSQKAQLAQVKSIDVCALNPEAFLGTESALGPLHKSILAFY